MTIIRPLLLQTRLTFCAVLLFFCISLFAQSGGQRFSFADGKPPVGWSKTSSLTVTPADGYFQLRGTTWDAKMWHTATLPAGDYLLSGKGSGKIKVYVLSNNPFKGGSWGTIAGFINLSGSDMHIEERPFSFRGGETLIVAHIDGPSDSARLEWLEISPKPAPKQDAASVSREQAMESLFAGYEAAKNESGSSAGKKLRESAERSAAPGLIAMIPHPAAMTIDGDDADWNAIPVTGTLSTMNGAAALPAESDASVSFKAACSDDELFLNVRITDDVLQFAKKNAPYENDCIELFIDPLFLRLPQYDDSSMQIFVTPSSGNVQDVVAKGKVPMRVKAVTVNNGWAFEASLPLSNDYFIIRPCDGLPIGFNISYNDNDSGSGRRHKITWSRQDTGDASWSRTDVFGALVTAGSVDRPFIPATASPMVLVRKKLRTAGEALTNVALLERERPDPPVVRGFMSGALQEGKAFVDMRHWGANVVRLQFGPNSASKRNTEYWKPDHLPVFLDWLENAVSNAQHASIKVVLDCHGLPTGKPDESAAYWNDPELETAFCSLWKAIAVRMTPYRKTIWGYDLFNEPLDRGQLPYAPREWRPLAVKIIKAIRSVDPSTWIIYEVGPGGGARGFDDLLPLPDARVIYSFHFYDPGTFTHQGVSQLQDAGLRVDASPAAVSYPGVISGSTYNREALERGCKNVIAFQQKWRVPIFVGEFSVIAWAPVDSAVAWLTDVIDLFEKHGWSWAYHAFREYQGWSLEHEEGVFPGKGKTPKRAEKETERAKVVKRGLARNTDALK
ncbi:MAG: cellulase family glycosylhydrolase [Spirochaetes bacterium]|nr:cellulase family glycosylhydrolase [Spirochaetota bacterium]